MRESIKQTLEDLDKGYLYVLYTSFDGIYGILLAAISIIVTLIIGISGTISLIKAAFILIGILAIISILTLFKSSFDLFDIARDLKHKKMLPKVIEGRIPYTRDAEAKALCILEPSEFFFYNLEVSFYYRRETHEQIIGYGEVINIQDSFIQVQMYEALEGFEDIVLKIIQNNAETLERLSVKPFVPKRRDKEVSR